MKEEVKKWLEKAEEDLKAAEYNYKGNFLDVAVFLSHQAAEKALKSLYITKKGRLLKTHNLVQLARELEAPDELIEPCAEITPAYTSSRYPDVRSIYKKEDVKRVIEAAHEVIGWVKSNLMI